MPLRFGAAGGGAGHPCGALLLAPLCGCPCEAARVRLPVEMPV
jgi:hypothetical protein